MTSEVYVNGKRAGGHVGGYLGFRVDITDYVTGDGKDSVYVRVDNSIDRGLIPSQKADFFIYGGLTRDVWLETIPASRLVDAVVRTPNVSATEATVSVEIGFAGPQAKPKTGNLPTSMGPLGRQVRVQVRNAKGAIVAERTEPTVIGADSKQLTLPTIKDPELWSPKRPYLYSISIDMIDGAKVVDHLEQPLGLRFYAFAEHGAFYLNGERLLLRGTHRHEEHAGYGAAMPDSLHRADIAQMKDMGVNFLRLGHYPQDPEIYRACDELGIIVWDELPWCRGGLGDVAWQATTKRLFAEQIKQNINHPSIVFWSLGNEVYWLPDFDGGDDTTKLNAFVTELNDIAHELDPSRLTAMRKYYEGADLVDVFSPSIWSGWYAGVYTNYGPTLTKNQKLYPHFLHMEYGGSSHVGRHTESPLVKVGSVDEDGWAEVSNQVGMANIAQDGDWTESYIVDLFDWHLTVSETQPDFAGNAQWAFKDFGTPLRPTNPIPYMNQKGLVDRSGKPKDAYYVYKSYWSDDPFCYIESHTWTERFGESGKTRPVVVYSNADSVELFLDDKSHGWRTRTLGVLPAGGLQWEVMFAEGNNTLRSVGHHKGKVTSSDEMTLDYSYTTPGSVDGLSLSKSLLPNGSLLITALAVDSKGRRILDYEEPVYFDLNGKGKLMADYGTPTRSQVIEMANGRATIEVEPGGSGQGVIEVRNQDFKGTYLTLDFDNHPPARSISAPVETSLLANPK